MTAQLTIPHGRTRLRADATTDTDRRLSPLRIALYGAACYLCVLVLAPIRLRQDAMLAPLAFVLTAYAAFALGVSMFRLPSLPRRPAMDPGYVYWIVVGLASAGIVLRLFDRFAIRGISLDQDTVEKREMIEAVGSNIFSVSAAALVPFCFLTLFVYFMWARHRKSSLALLSLSTAVFTFPALDAALIGSRSILLVTCGLLYLYLVYFGKIRPNLRSTLLASLALVTVMAISSAMFLERLSAMGMDPIYSVFNSGYAVMVQPNAWIAEELATLEQDSVLFQILFTYLNFTQYFVHGLFEFFYLYDNFTGDHTDGALTFSVYYKFGAGVLGVPFDQEAILAAQPRVGIFSSFFGPLFIDFWWMGIPVMFGLGVLSRRLWRAMRRRDDRAVPLYLYLVVVVFFFPVVNLISSAQGLYSITAFLIFSMSCRVMETRGGPGGA